MPELQAKEIRGINLKQIIPYTIGIISIAFLYADLRNNTIKNREVMQSMQQDLKDQQTNNRDQQKMNEIRLKDIENSQRVFDIRLTIMETHLNDDKK